MTVNTITIIVNFNIYTYTTLHTVQITHIYTQVHTYTHAHTHIHTEHVHTSDITPEHRAAVDETLTE